MSSNYVGNFWYLGEVRLSWPGKISKLSIQHFLARSARDGRERGGRSSRTAGIFQKDSTNAYYLLNVMSMI